MPLASPLQVACSLRAGPFALHNWCPPPETEQPALTIDPRHLDFGEVWVDFQELDIHLPVRNTSTRPVHIHEFQTGCNCRPVEPSTLSLNPGETRDIRLTLTDLHRPEFVGRACPIQIDLRPVVDDKPAKGWMIRGVIRRRIETDLTAVLFGESNRVGEPPVSRTITARFHQSGVASAKLVPDVADVEVRPGATGTEWKITVSPRTNREPGPFQGVLTIRNIPPNGDAPIASHDLPVNGVLLEGN